MLVRLTTAEPMIGGMAVLRQAAAVSPTQVKDLIARELDPAAEVVITLGDRASVTKAFADAGIRDVKLVEPDYR